MEREIKIPNISDIKGIQSHEWMVNDLVRSIRDAKANYLTALGLFCYTEALGLQLLQFKERDLTKKFGSRESFDIFAREYLGYATLLDKHDVYNIFRNGLCHEYFIKVERGGLGGVYHYYSDDDIEKLKSQGIDVSKGIAISEDGRNRIFVIEPYLSDFIDAIRRLSQEMKKESWNPDLI